MIVKVQLHPDEVVIHGQNGGVLWSSKEQRYLDMGKAVNEGQPVRYFQASWLKGKVALHKVVKGYSF